MKIVFTKLTDKGYVDTEYTIKAVKYGRGLIAFETVDEGWKALQQDQYEMFAITES